MSLTATAIAATAAPAGVAARTTWPTSWMPAPAQAPNCRSLSPKGPASSGRSTTARGPEQDHHRGGGGDVLVVGACGVSRRDDGRGAAGGEGGAEEQAAGRAQAQPGAEPGGEQQGAHDADGDHGEQREPERGDGGEGRREAEQDDADLEQRLAEQPEVSWPRCGAARRCSPPGCPGRCPRSGSRPGAPADDPAASRPARAPGRPERPLGPATKERVAGRRRRCGWLVRSCAVRPEGGGGVMGGSPTRPRGTRVGEPPARGGVGRAQTIGWPMMPARSILRTSGK